MESISYGMNKKWVRDMKVDESLFLDPQNSVGPESKLDNVIRSLHILRKPTLCSFVRQYLTLHLVPIDTEKGGEGMIAVNFQR